MFQLLALFRVVVDGGGELQLDEREARARGVAGFNAENVLMVARAGFEGNAVGNGNVGALPAVPVFLAVQPFVRDGGRAHGLRSLAADDISVAPERLLVKGEDFVLRVGCLVVHDLYSELPFAKSHVHVRGFVSVFVGRNGRAGIDGQAHIGGIGFVGADVQAAQRRVDFDVLLVAVCVLVHLDAAAGREQQADGEKRRDFFHGGALLQKYRCTQIRETKIREEVREILNICSMPVPRVGRSGLYVRITGAGTVDEGPSLHQNQGLMVKQTSHKKSKAPTPISAAAIPDKLYFRIGDVAELCGVEAYVLRFWETEFPQLKPNKSGTGQRLYRRRDVELALRIKQLLYADGYTIAGARQVFAVESRESKKVSQNELPLKQRKGEESAEKQLVKLRGELKEILGLLSSPVRQERRSEKVRSASRNDGRSERGLFDV
jgi:DNA-binding transcriptional MerR regulator